MAVKEIIKLRAFLRLGIVQLPRFFAACSASGSGHGFSRLAPPGTQSNGKRSFIRPTQPPTEHKKVEQKQAPPAPARAKQSRLAGKLKASIKNLKQVLSRNGEPSKKPVRKLPKSNVPRYDTPWVQAANDGENAGSGEQA